jgi:uncharacterized protein (TIGR00255 family)
MTAFAREESRGELGELVWELRSVNHRYLEVSVRLPEELRVLEPVVRERVARRLSRGKVDCSLRFRPQVGAAGELRVNERLVEQLLSAVELVRGHLPASHGITPMDVLRWPGIVEAMEQDLGPVQAAASELLDQALQDLVTARDREGERLAELVRQRCAAMREQVERARRRIPEVLAGLRERLRSRLAELAEEIDPARLEQELVLLAQKLDVAEEMDRLATHLDEVERVLGQNEPVGRRLDFLMQELNREANTLGSKSVDSETTAVSVEMKVLIEQMREQVQNIE